MPQIAGKEVGEIAFGMMGLTLIPGRVPEEQAIEAMRTAVANGLTLFNAGEFYGPESQNSMVLLEKYLTKYPQDADKIVLSVKGGAEKGNPMIWDSSRDNIRRSVLDSAAQLQGKIKIHTFEIARHDGKTPWETSLGALDELVKEGAIGSISLSEVSAESIHKAAALTKIESVEIELSLMCTDALHNGIVEACAKHGIPILAYSPIGHGLLSGSMKTLEDIPPQLRIWPRFTAENFPTNVQLVHEVEKLAKKKGVTPAQIAINWVRCLAKRPGMPTIIPVPGGSSETRVEENAKIVDLSDEEMAEIDAILAKIDIKGRRYPDVIPINC